MTDNYILNLLFTIYLGKPVMIVTEYMENGSLDSFLRVSRRFYIYSYISYLTCIYNHGMNY